MHHILDLAENFYGDVSATKSFPSLKILTIKRLPEWERWHIPEGEVFNRLEKLSISGCPKLIGELPQQLPSLQSLKISGCGNLVRPNGQLSILNGENQQNFSSLRQLKISELENLKELPVQLNQLSRLEELNISKLENLEELPPQLNQLSRLEKLTVDDCRSLSPSHVSRLPASLKSLAYLCCNLELEGGGALEYLKLGGCDLKVKAEWLASFPMLKRLEIRYCRSVENQSGITTATCIVMTSLQSLDIYGYDDLIMSFSEGGLAAPNLTTISIGDCWKLTSLPKQMESLLASLRRLHLNNCPEIECFPKGGLPSGLQSLDINNCKKLMSRRREWGLEKLLFFTHLGISGSDEESFPEEDWLLPCTLRTLNLSFLKNLKVLNYLALRHLASLEELCIYHCLRLQSLPEEGLPASLTKLRVNKCPLLKPRLEWEKGQDWPKVARIPCVVVEDELVP